MLHCLPKLQQPTPFSSGVAAQQAALQRRRSTAAGSVVDDDCHLLAEARVRPRLLDLGREMETSLKRFLEQAPLQTVQREGRTTGQQLLP